MTLLKKNGESYSIWSLRRRIKQGMGLGWDSADTAQFAVNSIPTWWNMQGIEQDPNTNEILITADCGGNNGYRTR